MKLLLGVFLFSFMAFAQGTDAIVTGIVLDPADAAVPDATVTALNVDTGVASTVKSNSSGAYEFTALLPGPYRLSAEKTGFKKVVLNNLVLHTGDKVAQNLKLDVGGATETVQVTANPDGVQYLTSSQGGTITSARILDLPATDRNAMDFVSTQPGMVTNGNGAFMNGARADMVNITLDGANVQDNFITESLGTTQIFLSVDRVEEVKVVTSPADAEYGRGSGQVQLVSRSGTNQYHGSLFDQMQNSYLNANSWSNNRQGTNTATGLPAAPRTFRIYNDMGGRLGGPIRKNKTFFFGLFEANIQHQRASVNATTLTNSARNGIFRYWPGVTNGNAQAGKPSVDSAGNPIQPAGATGPLQSVNLFGLDPSRPTPDSTGIVAQNLGFLPPPNNYNTGDGLNTAGYTWIQKQFDDVYSYTVRIDHNFNDKHRLTGSLSRDTETDPNGFDGQPLPTSPAGMYKDTGLTGNVALNSTFSPSLINEFRIGITRNSVQFEAPWTDQSKGQGILPTLNGVPYVLAFPGSTATSILGSGTGEDPQGRLSPVYEARDRVTYLHGRHSFKAGIDRRYTSANSFVSFDAVPRVNLGVAANAPTQGIATLGGIGGNVTVANNLLALLAGSVASESQFFYASPGANPTYPPGQNAQHTWKEREWSAFFQDDFKATHNLTLSFGLRWDYYGSPFAATGNLASIVGGSQNIFGISGTNLGALFNPGVYNLNNLTNFQYIGANSAHPDQNIWKNNLHNFAPVAGLAYSLPFWGENKTVIRAGYGLAYERNTLVLVDQLSGYSVPGYLNQVSVSPTTYQNLVTAHLPLSPTQAPFATVPINDTNSSTQTALVADSGLKTPYIQNWNVSIGRQLARGWTLDVRYVASKGTKLYRGTNIDEINVLESGILTAFQQADAGANSPLLNQIFKGLNVSGAGVVDGVNVTGTQAVRNNGTLNAFLVANNVGGLANFIAYNTFITGIRGGLIKNGGLPPNLIAANPQFGAADYISNTSNSTYNSGQVEVNKRFANGFSFQGSYVFSKALGDYDGTSQSENTSYQTLRNLHLDKRLLSFDATNVIRINGIYELPFGPGKKFLSSNHGLVAHLVENWQLAAIFNKLSGAPTSFSDSAGGTFNNLASALPTLFGPIPSGSVYKSGNNVMYFTGLKQITDPSIGNFQGANSSILTNQFGLLAIANANGQVVLQNPTIGTLGGLSPTAYRGLGSFTFNINASKAVVINREHNISLKVRIDASNVLNHPIWGTPNLNIDSTSFGLITSASGNRTVTLTGRLEF